MNLFSQLALQPHLFRRHLCGANAYFSFIRYSWSSRVSLLRQFNRRFEDATRGYGGFGWFSVIGYLVVAITFIVLASGSLLMVGQIPQEILPRINTGQANLLPSFLPVLL